MAQVLKKAAAKKIDFDYAYGSTKGKEGFAVFAAKSLSKALTVINS